MLGVLLLVAAQGIAQKQRVKNLPKFDRRPIHFGFTIGYNSADFILTKKPEYSFTDSLLFINHKSQPGFDLGIVSDLHLNDNLNLRFLPNISFQDRALDYGFLLPDEEVDIIEKRVESTFLDFPLNLKYRTHRVNNFAAYVIAGGQMSVDMASQEDVNNAVNVEKIVKIRKINYAAQAGAGFDFFSYVTMMREYFLPSGHKKRFL